MREQYPKLCSEIMIRETRHISTPDSLKQDIEHRDITLDQKLSEYMLQMGYSNSHTLGIVVQLMTRGKIKVEFRNYRERLELLDYADMLNKAQAVTLFDDYIATMNGSDSAEPEKNVTMKIVVQSREFSK